LWVVAEAAGSSVTYDRMSETVNAIYARAEVARPPKPLHCVRHTFGTVMAKRVARVFGSGLAATWQQESSATRDDP
jgi:hypothetical protein